jgi:hypothetical protein
MAARLKPMLTQLANRTFWNNPRRPEGLLTPRKFKSIGNDSTHGHDVQNEVVSGRQLNQN